MVTDSDFAVTGGNGEGGRYKALYSDGQTARSHDVTVIAADKGLELYDEAGQQIERWPYHLLTTLQPLDPGQSAQLGHKEVVGARLFVERGDFAAELLTHLPHMSRQAATRRVVIPLFSIGAIILATIAAIWISGYSVSGAIAHLLPDNVRKGFGSQVVTSLSQGKKACHSPAGDKALKILVERLKTAAAHDEEFSIEIMPLSMLNAFAAPGERIVVGSKLVDFVKSPEELAGVIAHEMGHGIKMHPEAGIVRALGISAGINIMFGGSAGSLGELGAMLLQLKYTRTAEEEADAIALDILQKAQIPARPFASFFEKLEARQSGRSKKKIAKRRDNEGKETVKEPKTSERYGSTPFDLLRTHPPSPDRIRVITSQPAWPTRKLLTPAQWKDLRAICK